MKQFLWLAMLCHFSTAFSIKITGMAGVHSTSIESDLTFKKLIFSGPLNDDYLNKRFVSDNIKFDIAFKQNFVPFFMGLCNVELIKINNIKIGIVGGYGLAKISSCLTQSFDMAQIFDQNKMSEEEIEEFVPQGDCTIISQTLFISNLNNFFGPYIGYSIKKIDIFVGAGAWLMEGEYKLLLDKQNHNIKLIKDALNLKNDPYFKTNKILAMNILFGAEYNINNKFSINAMCLIMLPLDLKFSKSSLDKEKFNKFFDFEGEAIKKIWIDSYKNSKIKIKAMRFLIGATYRIL